MILILQYAGFERIDAKTNKILSKEVKFSDNKIIDMNKSPEEVISINTALWNKIYKTSILKEINDIENPPRILEDMMFLALVYLKINKISFVGEYLYYYMVREGSAMNTLKENETESIQQVMINIKDEYTKNECSKEKMEVLSSMAFLHFGISLMLKVFENNRKEFKKEYKKNLKFLDKNFIEWRTTKYLKIGYTFFKCRKNLKVAIVKKMYILNLFTLFLNTYKFVTEKLKIDIKW